MVIYEFSELCSPTLNQCIRTGVYFLPKIQASKEVLNTLSRLVVSPSGSQKVARMKLDRFRAIFLQEILRCADLICPEHGLEWSFKYCLQIRIFVCTLLPTIRKAKDLRLHLPHLKQTEVFKWLLCVTRKTSLATTLTNLVSKYKVPYATSFGKISLIAFRCSESIELARKD